MPPSLPDALTARYTIERELGRGGMGAVYLARDRTLDRHVALKVLPPEIASDAGLRDRFLRETRVAASFSHPNIVPVYAVEQHDGVLAYAMGFVDGESLAARVARMGPLPIREVVSLLQDVCYALAYAHGREIVHRDLKPDNIMIERATGRALLMDFGVARTISSARAANTTALTRVGEVVGTPEYMSPEQASGDVVDGRSDLYALGLVAFYALSGRPAFSGTSTQQLIVKQLTEAPPPIASVRADTPPALVELIEHCLAKEPAARFPDAGAVLEALDRAQVVGPQIPLPVRLFVQDVQTVLLIFVFGLLVVITEGAAALDLSLREGFLAHGDKFIPVVILFAVLLTRTLQLASQGRRLALAGFTADDVQSTVRAVGQERDEVRQQNAANPEVRARRQRTVRTAIGMVLGAVALIVFAFTTRRQLSPTAFYTPPIGLAALFTALSLFGASFVLFLQSPLRAPVFERVLQAVWLSPLGRLALRLAMGRVPADRVAAGGRRITGVTTLPGGSGVRAAPGGVRAVNDIVPTSSAASGGTDLESATAQRDAVPTVGDRLDALEARVSALEQRRG